MAEPFVVALPSGTHTRTRLRLTDTEAEVLTQTGQLLGSLFRADVALLCREPRASRTMRKQALTAATSSRWAGAITGRAAQQVAFARDGLFRRRVSLRQRIDVLERRLAAPLGQKGKKGTQARGYASRQEWFAKSRRLAALRDELAHVEELTTQKRPRVVLGGKSLLHKRNNLSAANLTEQQWREQWDASRLFLTAVGESGKAGGNETIRVTPDGIVVIKLPNQIAQKYNQTHLTLSTPITFSTHRGDEWLDRIVTNTSLTYTITKDVEKDRWYLDVSWSVDDTPTPTVGQLLSQRRIGVDVNADHLAAHIVDAYGNAVGPPITIPLNLAGLPTSTRDAHLRHAITQLLTLARQHDITVMAIENLNFQDARDTGRETMGRGRRGKTFRRTVANMPTAKFRDRLVSMAATAGVWIIAIDPAYTSQWGNDYWGAATQTSSEKQRTRHHAAAIAIGRRSSNYRIRRRKPRPAARQRTGSGIRETGRSGTSTTRTATPPHGNKPDRSRDTAARAQHRSRLTATPSD